MPPPSGLLPTNTSLSQEADAGDHALASGWWGLGDRASLRTVSVLWSPCRGPFPFGVRQSGLPRGAVLMLRTRACLSAWGLVVECGPASPVLPPPLPLLPFLPLGTPSLLRFCSSLGGSPHRADRSLLLPSRCSPGVDTKPGRTGRRGAHLPHFHGGRQPAAGAQVTHPGCHSRPWAQRWQRAPPRRDAPPACAGEPRAPWGALSGNTMTH